MTDLLDSVRATITRHALIRPGETVVVGVSGGADSLVLLHLLARLREEWGLALHVATLDHGIRGAAGAADADFVRRTAAAWGIPATVGRADVPAAARAANLGLEEAARQVRYTFLLRVARRLGAPKIAVGHHQDDQAETVLMHLIRGSGLSGLRGMLPGTPLDDYHLLPDAAITIEPPEPEGVPAPDLRPLLVRPLLETPRAAIEAYAAEHGLQARQDATNADLTYFRNRLRHEALPLLETLNPNIRAVLARTAEVLRDDAALIRQVGEAALARVLAAAEPDAVHLDRGGWAGLAVSEKRHIVQAVVWRLRPDLRDVTFSHVERAIQVADRGTVGTSATLPGGLALRVGYVTLSIGPAAAAFELLPGQDAPALPGNTSGRVFLPGETVRLRFGGWQFEAGPLDPEADPDTIHADPLAVVLAVPSGAWLKLRPRVPGDRFQPRGMGGRSQKLGDTLINMKVPTGWRDRVPLLTVDDGVAWFVAPTASGLRGRVAEPFAVPDDAGHLNDTVRIVARWRPLDESME